MLLGPDSVAAVFFARLWPVFFFSFFSFLFTEADCARRALSHPKMARFAQMSDEEKDDKGKEEEEEEDSGEGSGEEKVGLSELSRASGRDALLLRLGRDGARKRALICFKD